MLPQNRKMINAGGVHFLILGRHWRASRPNFIDFGVQNRVPGMQFSLFGKVFLFDLDFGANIIKKTKKTKNEKVGFDMLFTMFREGRQVRKNAREQ